MMVSCATDKGWSVLVDLEEFICGWMKVEEFSILNDTWIEWIDELKTFGSP